MSYISRYPTCDLWINIFNYLSITDAINFYIEVLNDKRKSEDNKNHDEIVKSIIELFQKFSRIIELRDGPDNLCPYDLLEKIDEAKHFKLYKCRNCGRPDSDHSYVKINAYTTKRLCKHVRLVDDTYRLRERHEVDKTFEYKSRKISYKCCNPKCFYSHKRILNLNQRQKFGMIKLSELSLVSPPICNNSLHFKCCHRLKIYKKKGHSCEERAKYCCLSDKKLRKYSVIIDNNKISFDCCRHGIN